MPSDGSNVVLTPENVRRFWTAVSKPVYKRNTAQCLERVAFHLYERGPIPVMDSLHYRLIFDLDNKNRISGKKFLKVVKFQNLVEKML